MGSEEVKKERNSGLRMCKTVVKITFSHIGLCFMVVLYCILGAVLFELLERDNEITICMDARKEYTDMENETLFSILDIILKNPISSEATDKQLIGVFETFRNNSFSIGYTGDWCEGFEKPDGPMHEWNFAGSLFFAMTIVTTIGYGHIAPKTAWGRILSISYAMVGIPLMLLFLTNIGVALADIFRYVYFKVICFGCCRSRKRGNGEPDDADGVQNGKKEYSNVAKVEPGYATILAIKNAKMISGSESSTLAGSNSPTASYHNESLGMKQRTGMMGTTGSMKLMDGASIAQRGIKLRVSPSQSTEPLIIDDDSDDEYEEEEWDEINKVSIPLTVSLAIIGLYIIFGALLFKYWEGWDMLQSAYFCFITLSSIGFGDVTPSRDYSDPLTNFRLVVCYMYTTFGMAILSMSFTLMQQEMTEKFMWIGRKMGVVDPDDPDEEVEEEIPSHSHGNQSEC